MNVKQLILKLYTAKSVDELNWKGYGNFVIWAENFNKED